MTLFGPEHRLVREPLIEELIARGWLREQLQFEPEWRVPKTPSEASKRELGHRFEAYPVDLAIFDDPKHVGEYEHLLGIVETKAPTLEVGLNQLEILLANEPYARFGFWTNSKDRCLIFRAADGSLLRQAHQQIPGPAGPFILESVSKLTWSELREPTVVELRRTLNRLLNAIVSNDARTTRREDQLNQLCNLVLAKLRSDEEGRLRPEEPVAFQVWENAAKTASKANKVYKTLFLAHRDLFDESEQQLIRFEPDTIHTAAYELGRFRLLEAPIETVSQAFQVFRAANLKSGEGQYYTPYPVIQSAIEFLEISIDDKVIDPACGTGGFLLEAFKSLRKNTPAVRDIDAIRWAQRHLFGVDKDSINVKLTKALMLIIGDGSTHIYRGDALRAHLWDTEFASMKAAFASENYTCVVTNPPFGEDLKLRAAEAKASSYTITLRPKTRRDPATTFEIGQHEDRELGIVYLERCHALLVPGGRLGIILPETYFFSPTYSWLQGWLRERFDLIGVLNVPMEAFQGFCRAKTNFYVFQKHGG